MGHDICSKVLCTDGLKLAHSRSHFIKGFPLIWAWIVINNDRVMDKHLCAYNRVNDDAATWKILSGSPIIAA